MLLSERYFELGGTAYDLQWMLNIGILEEEMLGDCQVQIRNSRMERNVR